MQSRAHSLIESLTNIAIGYGVAVLTQVLVFPLYGIAVSWRGNASMGAIFTVVSLARSYALRRAFNGWHGRHSQ